MRALLIGLLLVLGLGAGAAEPRKYAVLSLIGDGFLLVNHAMEAGSHLDRNKQEFVELPDPVIDNTAVLAIERAVHAAQPDAKVVLLGARDPALFAAQRKSLEEAGATQGIVASLREAARGAHATHLILVTKLRHEAMLKKQHTYTGSGKLEGVGFYMDSTTHANRTGGGFLAPFAYFKVTLVDLGTGATRAEEDVIASTTRSAGRGDSLHPWDALGPGEKVRVLQSLIRGEIARVMPELLKK